MSYVLMTIVTIRVTMYNIYTGLGRGLPTHRHSTKTVTVIELLIIHQTVTTRDRLWINYKFINQ